MAIDISNDTLYKYTWDGLSAEESLRVYVSELGENYQERRGRGINPLRSRWSVNFIFDSLEGFRAFLGLLRTSAGEVFLWQSPIDTSASGYIIDGWNITPSSPVLYQVSCVLQSWRGNT